MREDLPKKCVFLVEGEEERGERRDLNDDRLRNEKVRCCSKNRVRLVYIIK